MSEQQPEQLVTLFVTNAARVSSGERTPGVVHVPPAEAARLVNRKTAVHGDQPPRGFGDRYDSGLRQ